MSEKFNSRGGSPEVRAEPEADAPSHKMGHGAVDRYWATQFTDNVEQDARPFDENRLKEVEENALRSSNEREEDNE